MSTIKLNFDGNAVLQENTTVEPIDAKKLQHLRLLVDRHLPRFDSNHPITFRWDGQKLTMSQRDKDTCVENYESIKELLEALAQIAPSETKNLEYGVHGIKNTTGHHCWVASALQLAYNLFPERLDSFLPKYQEVCSSADFAEYFLDLKGNQENDPQEVLSRIVDTSIEPVNMTLKELHLSQRSARCWVETICNTFVVSSSESDDFNTLLSSSLKGCSDKETTTYTASDFEINIPANPPHLSFDLRNCAQSRSSDGHLTRKAIYNIPLHLNSTHLGVSCSLDLKGAILHFGDTDLAANNHYVALFQKPHPITNTPQWFLANDSLISPVSFDEVKKLLPRATHLYYESNSKKQHLDYTLEDPLVARSTDQRVQNLKDIVTDLLSLRFEEKMPLSWFELLSDAFHGCDAVSTLDEEMMKKSLILLHKKLLPKVDLPHSSSTEELSFLQRKLLCVAQEKLEDLKKELSMNQEKMLQTQHQAKKEADKKPNIFQRIATFIDTFFAPEVYYA